MKALLRTVFFLAVSVVCTKQAEAQTIDPSFSVTDVYQPATIRAAARQADGKYVVSGNFLKVNDTAATSLARLNANGTLDQQFTSTAAVQTAPTGLRILPSGRILLFGAGNLTVAGQSFRNLVQLNTDGTLGPTLNTGTGAGGGLARVVAVQPDGKILLGGLFTTFNSVASARLVRLNIDGTVDTQFSTNLGTGFTGEVTTMLVQPDGKIVVGGRFQDFNGTGRRLLLRLNTDGTYDSGFVPVLNGPAYASVGHLGLDPRNNNLIIEGSGLQNQSGVFQSVQRLTATGAADPQFFAASGQVNCYANDYYGNDQLAVDNQGRVLYGGCFERYYGTTVVNSSLVRLLPNGTVDPQFAPGPALLGTINNVLLQPDGNILVAGNLKNAFTTIGASIIRLNDTAQPDVAFQAELLATGQVLKVLSQPDGKLLVAGRFTNINGQPASNIARLLADGTRDNTFLPTGPDYAVEAVALQPDGRILVGGTFKKVGGNSANLVARLQADGTYDPSFSTSLISNASNVGAIAVQADGKVLVGGSSLTFTGTLGTAIHRLLPDGQTDQAYEANLIAATIKPEQVLSFALLPDGRLYAGGFFAPGNLNPGPVLTRFNPDGTLDPTFTLPVFTTQALVQRVLSLPNGQALIGGQFTGYNGVARNDLARLNADGTVDTGFTSALSPNADINDIALQPNGRLLVSSYTTLGVNGIAKGPLVRLLPDGAFDNSFAATPSLVNSYVTSIAVQDMGGIVIGGPFTQASGAPRVAMARLMAPEVLAAKQPTTDVALTVWPNPAHSTLNLRLNPTMQPQRVELLDFTGRVLRQELASRADTQLPVQGLTRGVYLVRVQYAASTVVRRVVIE